MQIPQPLTHSIAYPPRTVASARVLLDGTAILSTPYSRSFAASFLALVPRAAREWQPERRLWFVRPRPSPAALGLMVAFWPETVVEREALR